MENKIRVVIIPKKFTNAEGTEITYKAIFIANAYASVEVKAVKSDEKRLLKSIVGTLPNV